MLTTIVALSGCWVNFVDGTEATSSERPVQIVYICKAVEHEALDSVTKGIQDYFANNRNVRLGINTCQGNQALAAQIISRFVNHGKGLVVTIGTMPTQVAFKYAKEKRIKLIFSSVTNPDTIALSLKDTNTTGVSNFVALKPQLEIFKKIQPNLKKLGIIFNTGEANSVDIVEKLRIIAQELGIELVEQGIQKASDIPQAINTLSKRVDAVFISNDNTSLCAIPFIVRVCNKAKIPVYVSDTDQVEKGCLASLGPNQYDIGKQTGAIVAKILQGQDVNNISVEYPTSTELFINLNAAKLLGITVPEGALKQAQKVIGSSE
jgi:putative ABC transport system substrate-binding protein